MSQDPARADPDDLYARLIALHAGRTEMESRQINARLILLLIEQVGDRAKVLEAIAQAEAAGPPKL